MNIKAFTEQVEASLREVGADFKADKEEFRQYVASQVLMLQRCAGQNGYQRALVAARNSTFLFAVQGTVENADAAEYKLTLGIIQGVLAVLV